MEFRHLHESSVDNSSTERWRQKEVLGRETGMVITLRRRQQQQQQQQQRERLPPDVGDKSAQGVCFLPFSLLWAGIQYNSRIIFGVDILHALHGSSGSFVLFVSHIISSIFQNIRGSPWSLNWAHSSPTRTEQKNMVRAHPRVYTGVTLVLIKVGYVPFGRKNKKGIEKPAEPGTAPTRRGTTATSLTAFHTRLQ